MKIKTQTIRALTISDLKKELREIYPQEQYIIKKESLDFEGFRVKRKTNKKISTFFIIQWGFYKFKDSLSESYYYIPNVPKQKMEY